MLIGTIDGDSTTEILGYVKHMEKDRKYGIIGKSPIKPSPRGNKKARIYLDMVKKTEMIDQRPAVDKKKAYKNINIKKLMKHGS